MVITALTLLSGCVEDDIFGESSIYYLAEKETGAKSSVEFKPGALVVEETLCVGCVHILIRRVPEYPPITLDAGLVSSILAVVVLIPVYHR